MIGPLVLFHNKGQIERSSRCFGTVNGKFYAGSSHVTGYTANTATAKTISGNEYVLGEVDPSFATMYSGQPIAAFIKAIAENK